MQGVAETNDIVGGIQSEAEQPNDAKHIGSSDKGE